MEHENWTKEETLELIEEYKKFPFLYNSSHPNYNTYSNRKRAFQNIAENLQNIKPGIDADAIKKKIKILNRQMSYERNKMSIAQRDGKLYKPTLWCFLQLSFLLKSDDGNQSAEKFNSEEEGETNINEQTLRDGITNPNRYKQTLERCAKKSIQLITELLSNKSPQSKEDLFCAMICAELSDLDQEEIYDEVTMDILNVVRKAKEKERLLFERQQIAKEISQYIRHDDNSQSPQNSTNEL